MKVSNSKTTHRTQVKKIAICYFSVIKVISFTYENTGPLKKNPHYEENSACIFLLNWRMG